MMASGSRTVVAAWGSWASSEVRACRRSATAGASPKRPTSASTDCRAVAGSVSIRAHRPCPLSFDIRGVTAAHRAQASGSVGIEALIQALF